MLAKLLWAGCLLCLLALVPDGRAQAAGPLSPNLAYKQTSKMAASGLLFVHGFHCRREYGFNSATGYYQKHEHPGICADLERCTREHYRCLRIHGRGWHKWDYMRWGFDNRFYQACLIRADCY